MAHVIFVSADYCDDSNVCLIRSAQQCPTQIIGIPLSGDHFPANIDCTAVLFSFIEWPIYYQYSGRFMGIPDKLFIILEKENDRLEAPPWIHFH
jgi:hypothetical protein